MLAKTKYNIVPSTYVHDNAQANNGRTQAVSLQQRMPVAVKQCYQQLKARIAYTTKSMRKHSSGHNLRKLFLSDAGLMITRTLGGRQRWQTIWWVSGCQGVGGCSRPDN